MTSDIKQPLREKAEEGNYERTRTIRQLNNSKLWESNSRLEEVCEILFHIKRRNTTIRMEVIYGFIQFISCLYVLPVVPEQMHKAGYENKSSIIITAAACGIGSIIAGLFANLPFIIAPPTSISIFLSIYLQQQNLGPQEGSFAVIVSGIGLVLLGWRPLGQFCTKLIPHSIQVGTAVGIGLITALAGATEIKLVVSGEYTIVDLGEITPEIVITFAAIIIASVAMHYHIKGAFCIALLFGTFVWWIYKNAWPDGIFELNPHSDYFEGYHNVNKKDTVLLIFDLLFLYVLTLNGLVSSLSDLSSLTRSDGSTPRNRWLFIWCGITTIMSGLLTGPPILISPESAAGIKAGARTGLSTVVCGLLFIVSLFFTPIFEAVPYCGTSPLLILVGVILFQNVKKVNWNTIKDAVPAFCVLFFIPFTYSILQGVAIGYAMHLTIGVFTGDLYTSALRLYSDYFEPIDVDRLPFSSISAYLRHSMLSMDTMDNHVSLIFHDEDVANGERPHAKTDTESPDRPQSRTSQDVVDGKRESKENVTVDDAQNQI